MAALTRLPPRGPVRGGEAREPVAPLPPDREDARHEARQPLASRRQIEVARGGLDRHRRSERPELLAKLDAAVQLVPHRGVARRGQDAAVTERARAELARAIHPADDAPGAQLVRDAREQLRLRGPLAG